MKLAMVFEESVRGLQPGAEIDFRGVGVGTVTSIKPHVDPRARHFNITRRGGRLSTAHAARATTEERRC